MNDLGEQIGYLTALVEALKEDVNEHKESTKEWRTRMDEQLSALQKEIDMYATIVKTIKFLGAALVALLTFKWAVVLDLWQHFRAG